MPLAYFNSMLDQRFVPEYQECENASLFIHRPDGSLYTFAYKGAGPDAFYASLLDFTNPSTPAWFQAKMQEGLNLGNPPTHPPTHPPTYLPKSPTYSNSFISTTHPPIF